MKKMLIALMACAGANAATVSFTGTTSTDLASPANWEGGALPGNGDVAFVDFAGLGGASEISTTEDLSFAGLVLTNMPPTLTVSGAGKTITLGAEGWRNHRAATASTNTTISVNIATACAQTWEFLDDQNIAFNGTISGTELLTIKHDHFFIHNTPPGYGGKIFYTCKKDGWRGASLAAKGVWANDVEITGNGRLELRFLESATWSEIFPGRRVGKGATLLLTQPGKPHITFEDGDSFGGMAFVTDTGMVTQNGGSITSSVQVGYATYPSLHEMYGGNIKGTRLYIGNSPNTQWTTNQEFRLFGGLVEVGSVELGWRGNGDPMSHVDMTVRGGTMEVADTGAAYEGLHLAANLKAATETWIGSGVSAGYRQTGGTVKTPQVVLGAYPGEPNTWRTMRDCWVTLAMNGGLLDVGARGFNAMRQRWNVPENPSQTVNSRYRLSFTSGTLAAYAPFTSELDLTFTTNDSPFTIDTRANDVFLAAPIWGTGSIEKKGAGTLMIGDGSRYSGKLDVKEGAVKLMGAVAGGENLAGVECVVWRAEDAVEGLQENDEITNWSDASGTRTAVYDGVNKNGVAVTKPTAQLNAFNGHAGVKFNQSALKVASAINPLAGATNWTVCVVLKTSTAGLGSRGAAWYAARGIVGRELGSVQNDWGLVFDSTGGFCAGLGVNGNRGNIDHSNLYTQNANYADGETHVVFYSLDCDGKHTLAVDGEVRSQTVALDTVTKSPRRSEDIYLGVHNIADNGPRHYAFIGSVAEFRFYPDKALTAAERAGVGGALAAKYGASTAVCATGGDGAQIGEVVQSVADAAIPNDGAAAWEADSLDALEDGAAVESWPSVDGARVANLENGRLRMNSSVDLSTEVWSHIKAPTLVKGAFNGRPALRFDGSHALGVPAADSPVSGATQWTAAMVFRTANKEKPASSTPQFYAGRALFGAELPTSNRADWGIAFWGDQGRIVAGYGGRNAGGADNPKVSRAWDLYDGEPHILVAMFDTVGGNVNIFVDGVGVGQTVTKCSVETPRDAMRVSIGACNADYCFKGEIAAFRLYDRAISGEEMDALIAGWTDKYAVPPSPKYAHGAFESGRHGLGAKEISVAAGASLVLPIAQTSPFTLKGGQRLTASGRIDGTLGVGAGGVFDMAAATPAAIDGLWLRGGGKLRASFLQEAPVALSNFRADGIPEIEMTDKPTSVPAKFTLFTYTDSANVANGTTWKVTGASRTSTIVAENGKVVLQSALGTLLLVR